MARRHFRVLVICTGNRARSQMAEGWLRHFGGTRVSVDSAGTKPRGVHPLAIEVMAEVGIDITSHSSDHVDRYSENEYDLVLTVCDTARQNCPIFPNAKRTMHHAFEDPDYPEMPKDEFKNIFRRIRDEIRDFSSKLIDEFL